jgi:hypothetical protein
MGLLRLLRYVLIDGDLVLYDLLDNYFHGCFTFGIFYLRTCPLHNLKHPFLNEGGKLESSSNLVNNVCVF